jgi:hypothetical protein
MREEVNIVMFYLREVAPSLRRSFVYGLIFKEVPSFIYSQNMEKIR